MNIYFTPSVLQYDYFAFRDWVNANRPQLAKCEIEWLDAWDAWSLACSPMDDDLRRRIRYGHYLGWADHARWVADK